MKAAAFPALLLAACTVLSSAPARATTYFPEEFICPIGGEKFEAEVIGSHTTFGQRPDGKRYGTLPIFPIVECPSNGFLLIQDEFSSSEIAALTEAVASAEYQAMRTSETQNRRAWWLMKIIGSNPYALAGALLRASWETDEYPARKALYQAAFAEAAISLDPAADKDSDWFWLNLRAANALRELSRFEEAAALLEGLDRPDVLPSDPDQLEGARLLIDGLRLLIADANPASEPTNLIPARQASFRCVVDRTTLSAAEVLACKGSEVIDEIAETEVETENGQELVGEEAIRYIVETYWNQIES